MKIVAIFICCALLSSCAHVPGSGESYPYHGPLIDNAGNPVPPPVYRGVQ